MDLITFSLLTLGSFKPVFLELLIINRVASPSISYCSILSFFPLNIHSIFYSFYSYI